MPRIEHFSSDVASSPLYGANSPRQGYKSYNKEDLGGKKPCSLQPGDVLMFAPPRPLQELRAIEHFLGHGILTGCPVALAVGMD